MKAAFRKYILIKRDVKSTQETFLKLVRAVLDDDENSEFGGFMSIGRAFKCSRRCRIYKLAYRKLHAEKDSVADNYNNTITI